MGLGVKRRIKRVLVPSIKPWGVSLSTGVCVWEKHNTAATARTNNVRSSRIPLSVTSQVSSCIDQVPLPVAEPMLIVPR